MKPRVGLLLRLHPQRPIQSDHLPIQHRILINLLYQLCKFVRLSKAVGVRCIGGECFTRLNGEGVEHRCFEDAGGDGHDAHADVGEFAGQRQRHAHYAAL